MAATQLKTEEEPEMPSSFSGPFLGQIMSPLYSRTQGAKISLEIPSMTLLPLCCPLLCRKLWYTASRRAILFLWEHPQCCFPGVKSSAKRAAETALSTPPCPRGCKNRNASFRRYRVSGTWPKTPFSWEPAEPISKQWKQSCRFWSAYLIQMEKHGLEQIELEKTGTVLGTWGSQRWFCSTQVYLLVWPCVDACVASQLTSPNFLGPCLPSGQKVTAPWTHAPGVVSISLWIVAQEISLNPGLKARSWTGGVIQLETALHRAGLLTGSRSSFILHCDGAASEQKRKIKAFSVCYDFFWGF